MLVVLAYLRCLSFPYRSPSLLLHRITPGFFRTSWSSSLALQGKPMVLFGGTMKQWQLALSLSVGADARVFVAECDPFCDIEFVFQYVHPGTGAWFHEECVIAVREQTNFRLKICQRDVAKGLWSPWTRPVAVVSKIFREVIQVARKFENSAPHISYRGRPPRRVVAVLLMDSKAESNPHRVELGHQLVGRMERHSIWTRWTPKQTQTFTALSWRHQLVRRMERHSI